MKGLVIAASVAVILLVSAIALVIINADDTATASQTEATQPEADLAEPEADVPLPDFMEERLQELVERGFITQEQLDDMERRFREHGPWNGEVPEDFNPEQFRERFREHRPWNGGFPEGHGPEHFVGPGFGPHRFWFFGGDEDPMDLFGLTPEELMDALAEGTPLVDIIEDPDEFLDSLTGSLEERLRQAVEEGRLTQAEADVLIAEARSHAEAFINGDALEGERFLGPRGPHGFHDFGDFGPHHRFGTDAATAGYSV